MLFQAKKQVGAWGFKGEEGKSQEEQEEEMFGKQVFAEPHGNNRTQRGLWSNRPC